MLNREAGSPSSMLSNRNSSVRDCRLQKSRGKRSKYKRDRERGTHSPIDEGSITRWFISSLSCERLDSSPFYKKTSYNVHL